MVLVPENLLTWLFHWGTVVSKSKVLDRFRYRELGSSYRGRACEHRTQHSRLWHDRHRIWVGCSGFWKEASV